MEDSESDWDSMTEKGTLSKQNKTVQQDASQNAKNSGVLKKGNKEVIDSDVDTQPPPHSFRSEVDTPIPKGRNKVPGKPNKGRLYNPDLTKLDSTLEDSDEDPLYSTINKKLPKRLSVIDEKQLPSSSKHKSSHKLGLDNRGFEGDEYLERESSFRKVPEEKQTLSIPKKAFSSQLDVMMDEVDIYHESAQAVRNFNRGATIFFGYAAVPFMVTSSLVHHTMKFVLVAVVKSLILDPLNLFHRFFIKPLCETILHPVLLQVESLTVPIGNGVTSLLQPVISLAKSCRIVEIHQSTSPRIV